MDTSRLRFEYPLSLPRFRLPGAVIGTRRHADLGLVEFLASDSRKMILVATSKRVFAISPKEWHSLIRTFARATELGSLIPAEAKSVYPSFIITQAWESPFVALYVDKWNNISTLDCLSGLDCSFHPCRKFRLDLIPLERRMSPLPPCA